MAKTTTPLEDRKRARAAISHAKAAEKETKQLAKELPKGSARTRVELLVAQTRAVRLAAKSDRKRAPARAAKSAERVTVVLDQMAMRLVPGAERISDRRARRADAATRAKQRSKLIKKRRKQAKKIQGWAKTIAARTAVQSITTPTEAEAAKADRARVRRARREDARRQA
jgi:hypothetical protein